MTRSLLLVAALAIASAAHAHEPSQHVPVAPASAVVDAQLAPVAAVADGFNTALKTADFDRARTLLDPHVLILESGGAERSADEYFAHHAIDDAAFLGGATIQVRHRTGGVDGSTAWLATESEITPAPGSDIKPLLSTETLVLHRTAGAWRIVHVHWSSRAKKATP